MRFRSIKMSFTCLKFHVRTFGGKSPKQKCRNNLFRSEVLYIIADTCCEGFFMVLKHLNCLLNVIIKKILKSHVRTFGKIAESRSVETIYTDLRCFRLLQTLVVKVFYGFETHELSFKCDYRKFSEISWPDKKTKIELDGGGYRFDLTNFFI